MRAVDLRVVPMAHVSTGDEALDRQLGGGWPLGHSALLWGKGGGGKSRLAYRWATRIGPTLGVVCEHDLALARATAEGAGADLDQLFFLDAPSALHWQDEAERLEARAVIFDSVTAVRCDHVELVKALAEWARARRGFAFVIVQSTKSGKARGSEELSHWPDAAIAVHRRTKGRARLRVLKSRFCAVFSADVSLVAS